MTKSQKTKFVAYFLKTLYKAYRITPTQPVATITVKDIIDLIVEKYTYDAYDLNTKTIHDTVKQAEKILPHYIQELLEEISDDLTLPVENALTQKDADTPDENAVIANDEKYGYYI